MTETEFENLKACIESQIMQLNQLQAVYNRETGQDYTPPLRMDPLRVDFFNVEIEDAAGGSI